MMTSHPFNPEMLTLARMSRGMTQSELAVAAEVTQGRVSKIEHGFLDPADDLVDRFSAVLKYPRSFFYQPGYMQTLPSWFYRKRKQLARATLDRVHAEIAIRLRNIQKLLISIEIKTIHPVPQFDVDAFNGCVEDIARAVRDHWQMPRGPVPNLIETLEKAGVVLVPCDFGVTEIDAIGMRLQGMPPLVFMNSAAPTDRLRYTIAHELGHLVMHTLPSEEMEREANRFASEFLMPEHDIKPQLYNVTLSILAVLKRVWRVSMQALLTRAKDLRTITAKKATSLWKQMSAMGFRKREPAELDLSPEKPRLLADMLDYHMKQLGMTLDQLLTMFTLHQSDFERLYRPDRQPTRLRLIG